MAIIAAAVGGLIIAAGWFVTYWQRQRDIRSQVHLHYLLTAYRRLENASNREPMTPEQDHDVESALADIILLGSPGDVMLAMKFAKELETPGASTDELLKHLRQELRKQLNLKPISDFQVVRMSPSADRDWSADQHDSN